MVALRVYELGSIFSQPVGGTGYIRYYIVDTYAERPTSGMNVGDLMWSKDGSGGASSGALFVALTSTIWEPVAMGSNVMTLAGKDLDDSCLINSLAARYADGGPTRKLTWDLEGAAVGVNNIKVISSAIRIWELSADYNGKFGVFTAGGPQLTPGTYTPVASNLTNLDSVTPTIAQYMRMGSVVTVSGRFAADPTSASTSTSFFMTVPINSTLGAYADAAGVVTTSASANLSGEILSSLTANKVWAIWTSTGTASQNWAYHYTYQIN